MWLWSRPWPYSWLWGTGTDYQKTASVTVNITASSEPLLVNGSGPAYLSIGAVYYVTGSVDGLDAVEVGWESAQVYYASTSVTEASVSAGVDPDQVTTADAYLTAQVVYQVTGVGVTDYTGSIDANLSASASGVVAVSASASGDAYITASVTDFTVSIFYQYPASVTVNVTASVDWSKDIFQAVVSKSFNNSYFLSASSNVTLNNRTNRRGKLVGKKKRGYIYVPTSTL
jgi:hypothetical protein